MNVELEEKYEKLVEYLSQFERLAIAYSGGVDSAFLAKAAKDALGKNCLALFARGAMVSEREAKDAYRFAGDIGIECDTVEIDALKTEGFCENSIKRCYYCKSAIMGAILDRAKGRGYEILCEASNTDDLGDYRPGMQAVKELRILSPLVELKYSKQDIRQTSKMLGLKSWDKPSFACLASRVPYGELITEERLKRIEAAEEVLFNLGFVQLRVRDHGTVARIELPIEDIGRAMELRELIVIELKKCGFSYITIDMNGLVSGNMNSKLE